MLWLTKISLASTCASVMNMYQERQGIMWIPFSVTCYIRGNEKWIGARRLRKNFAGLFFLCRS